VRILYVAMANDYGDPARGPSFEETNFRSALEGMGHEVVPFDFIASERAAGREEMNSQLQEYADETKPDASFFVLFKDEIAPATIEAVGRTGGPTINWFADDHWRFDDFTRHFAPSLDVCVTTDQAAVPLYRALGVRTVVLSQWACNRYAYRRVTTDIEHEVTFVGQSYGRRPAIVQRLREAGRAVECWGHGWPAGRLDHEQMVRVFCSSAINLNLSNAWQPEYTRRMRLGALARGIKLDTRPRRDQIKGRNFEVPGCGGFLLTQRVPHLEDYFQPGREVAVFDDEDDLVSQVDYWVDHPDERAAVADAGYRRVLAEHTYDHRFDEIFRAAGLA
jgi:spore maturation protein CgeB